MTALRTPPREGASPCPICGRPADPRRRPFCSVRCADVDLGRWLSNGYAIPVPDEEIEDEARPPFAGGHAGSA